MLDFLSKHRAILLQNLRLALFVTVGIAAFDLLVDTPITVVKEVLTFGVLFVFYIGIDLYLGKFE